MSKNVKKTTIPKSMRIAVWDKYIGEEIGKTKCLSCNIHDISQLNFECGHIIAESKGGETSIENLRPVCNICNKSMATKNLFDFQNKVNSKIILLNEIKKKYNINNIISLEKLINSKDFSVFSICKYVCILAEKYYVYVGNDNNYKLYCFNGKVWKQDDTILKHFLSTALYDFLKVLLMELYFEHNMFNQMKNQVKKLKCTKFKKEIVETYKEVNTNDKIKFDNKYNLLGFDNIVYDLETGEFREYKYDDYISITTGYEWMEPSKDEIELIEKLIKQIMPMEDERQLYLQILSTTLDGKCLEKFIIFNGSGGNGKGMIDDLLLCALGNYGFIGNNSILFETNKTGSNPEKANIHKKRLVIFREPPENKRFENSIIKELTGGGNFCARGHHETNTKKELNLTMIVEANKKPLLAEEPMEADTRRIIDVLFRSSYTQDELKVDEKNHVYMANTFYKTAEFKEKYKFALLKILMNEYKKYKNNDYKLTIPKLIQERTRMYLELSNNIVQWFKDNYKITKIQTDYCKIKDLYDDFTKSNYFVNLSKNDKRKYNKSYFSEYITTNDFFKKYYHARFYSKQTGEIYSIINEWKKINEEIDD
jgi:phage/plasmid-associated DNA primase